MVPIPQIDEYIIVNYLQTMTISDTLDGEQIRVKGLNQKPYIVSSTRAICARTYTTR